MADKFEGEDRRAPEKWRLNKEISLADVLSFVAAALAVVYAYTTLDKRLSMVEVASVAQTTQDTRQDTDVLRLQARIDAQLDRMNDKLDRLIQRPPR